MGRRTRQLDAVEHRERAVAEQAARLVRQREVMRAAFAAVARQMVTRDAKAALVRGEMGAFRQAMRRPRPKDLVPVLRDYARSGIEAGMLDAERTADELVPTIRTDQIVSRVVDALQSGRFDEQDVKRLERIRRRREIRERKAGRTPRPRPERGPAPGTDTSYGRQLERSLKDESRRMSRGMRRVVKDMLEEAVKGDAAELDRERRLNELLDRIGSKHVDLEAEFRAAGLGSSDAQGAVADIDWSAFQIGAEQTYRADTLIRAWEWVSRRDDRVTCVCQLFDGNVIRCDDDDIEETRPQLHYHCRCNRYPVTIDSPRKATWDYRRRRTLGVPAAGGTKISLFVAPRDIQVPGSAPNVGPPRDCRDWLSFGRKPHHKRFTRKRELDKKHETDQHKLEMEYVREMMQRGDEHVRRLLESAGINLDTGLWAASEVGLSPGGVWV